MQSKTYSPKEIAAFRGLLQLAAGGNCFSNIKVQDIATAAGIGKGTLYEYFSSKEDILNCTVLYTLHQFADWMEQQMTRDVSLHALLARFLDALEQERFLPFHALPVLGTFLSYEQRAQLGMRNREQAQAIIDRMRGYEQRVLANSRKTGEIDPALSDRFCEYVILSALGGYVSMLEKRVCCREEISLDSCKDMVQQLIFRSLRP